MISRSRMHMSLITCMQCMTCCTKNKEFARSWLASKCTRHTRLNPLPRQMVAVLAVWNRHDEMRKIGDLESLP